MKLVKLGSQGLQVPAVGLGCMGMSDFYGSSSESENLKVLDRALEIGCNFWDTADMYGPFTNEILLSKALAGRRDKITLATKFGVSRGEDGSWLGIKGNAAYVKSSCDASLKRLGTDYIDLYQIHRWDYETPIEETLEALHDVVKSGKARYIGASSMFAWQFAKALYLADLHGWTRFVSMQNHYNLVYREEEREMNSLCLAEGVGLIPWSPLARGFLAGNRQRGESAGPTTRAKSDNFAHDMYYNNTDFDIVDRVVELASQKGVKPAQIALAWLLHRPGVTAPIIGASKMSHLKEAVAALDIRLSTEDCQYLEEPYQPHPVLGHS